MPSCTVTVRSAGTPSATSICRIASEAAMKQSTCRCFQRENEFPRRWKSTRRDATSAGCAAGACGGAERQRERRHGDAVRVVRVDDVRLQPLDDARQPPGRRQVHLGARRERDELEAFGGAAAQLAVRMRDERGPMPDLAQAVHGQQHLVLAAAPGPGGVDVEGEHQGSGLRGSGFEVQGSSSSSSEPRTLSSGPVAAPRASRTSGTRNTRSSPR